MQLTCLRHAIREWKQIKCNHLQTVEEACVKERTLQNWQSTILAGSVLPDEIHPDFQSQKKALMDENKYTR